MNALSFVQPTAAVVGEAGRTADLLTHVARQACLALDAQRACIFEAGFGRGGGSRLVAEWTAGEEPLQASAAAGAHVADRVIATGAPVGGHAARRFARPADDTSATTGLPLVVAGVVRGALVVSMPASDTTWDEGDEDRLEGLAGLATAVLAREDAREQVERTAAAGVEALAALAGLRDGYTGADAEELAQLADAIAVRLSMPDAERRDLAVAARVHDIGKIGVPDSILNKHGRLDVDERRVVQRHPVWGADTLSLIPGLDRVAAIVRYHHERWDGRGYPSRVAGRDIPLASRIIGVCEAYRALVRERPYRQPVAPGEALGLVAGGAGTHFDPAVTEALVGVLAPRGIRPERRGTVARDGRATPRDTGVGVARPESAPGVGFGHRLPRAFERLERLPALAASRNRLLRLVRDEHPSQDAIVAAVESDLALVIAILRLANAQPGQQGRIGSIAEAVARLAPEGIDVLVSRLSVADFFDRLPGWRTPPEHFRLHGVAVRQMAERVLSKIDRPNRAEVLVAALLHDVGKLVLDDAYDGYPGTVHGAARTPEERVAAERRELGIDHAMVGGVLLRRWGLPDVLAAAVERHHSPEPGSDAAVLRLADALVHYTQIRPVDPKQLTEAANALNIGPQTLRTLMYDIPGGAVGRHGPTEPSPLTPKQQQILQRLARGKSNKEIAAELGLSVSTVRSHLHHTYTTLGVPDRAQAVLMSAERGWI